MNKEVLINRSAGLKRKIEQMENYLNAPGLPGTFITGRSGVSRAYSNKLNRQLDKTIDYAVALPKMREYLGKMEQRLHPEMQVKAKAERKALNANANAILKEKDKATRDAMSTKERLLICQFPGGTTYCDRSIMKNGDYKKLVFKSNSGAVTWYAKRLPDDLREMIETDMNNAKAFPPL